MSTNLSKNFTLEELTFTDTGVPNIPNQEELEKLKRVANELLQPIRDKFGALYVSSGFRSKEVHAELTRRGYPTSSTSQHLLGEAVDFVPFAPYQEIFDWARKNLKFGQIIYETHKGRKWIHISLPRIDKPNQMALYFNDGIYTAAA